MNKVSIRKITLWLNSLDDGLTGYQLEFKSPLAEKARASLENIKLKISFSGLDDDPEVIERLIDLCNRHPFLKSNK